MTNHRVKCVRCEENWPTRERFGKLFHIIDDSEWPRSPECTNPRTILEDSTIRIVEETE